MAKAKPKKTGKKKKPAIVKSKNVCEYC